MSGKSVFRSLALILAFSIYPEVALSIPPNQTRFIPLGDLPGGTFSSTAHEVVRDRDGYRVVGQATSASGKQPVLWRVTSAGTVELQPLGDLAGGTSEGDALGICNRGRVPAVVGYSGALLPDESNTCEQPFFWTESLGMQPIGARCGRAQFVSNNCQTVVGYRQLSFTEAFVFTNRPGNLSNGTPGSANPNLGVRIIDPLRGYTNSRATAVSASGPTVVGWSDNGTGTAQQGFIWTPRAGTVALGFLPSTTSSRVNAISPNGITIVGVSGNEAFRRTRREGLVGLGTLSQTNKFSEAVSVNSSGNTIGGFSNGDAGTVTAFVWRSRQGMINLQTSLAVHGAAAEGWTLQAVLGVSDDGRAVVGFGTSPNGQSEAFLAEIPTLFRVRSPDVDGNGTVDSVDFTIARQCRGLPLTRFPQCIYADGDGDNDIDGADLTWVRISQGKTYPVNPNPIPPVGTLRP